MRTLLQDFRFGARMLAKNRGFAAVIVVTLALGIGANTAIFTLVDQVLLRLLPVENPRELVQLRLEGGRVGSQSGDGRHTFSYPMFLALRDSTTTLSGLTGQVVDAVSLVGDERSEMIRAGLVAGNFFDVLGVRPHLGRLLAPEHSRNKNTEPVAVLQYDFWKNRFGGKQDIVGSTIRLNGAPLTVIGVAAPDFEGTDIGLPTNVWAPITMRSVLSPPWDEFQDERSSWFYLFGRRKPGVTIEQAEAELKVLFRQRQEEELKAEFFSKFPELKDRFLKSSPTLIPAARGQSTIRSGFDRPLIVLQWLVGLVLLIACTNVANLLLARAVARQKEIAIRSAMGARRGRLIRQLLAESLIVATAGGIVGLLLTTWVAKVLVRFLPMNPETISLSTRPDLRVLLFTAATVVVTAVVFGLLPALQASRVSPGATLKEEAGSISGSRGHLRLRKALVGLQVGLSCLMLIGAGLFARTIQNLQNVDLGFKTDNVVMFGVRPATNYDDGRKLQVFRSVLENVAAVPGVKAAGANTSRLLTGGRWDSTVTIPGVEPKEGNQPWSFFNAVTPGYFDALGIPIKAGRDITWSDWGSGRKVCLVNEALVKEYFPGNPVGRTMAQGAKQTPDTEIIGVFGNSNYHQVRGEVPRQTFVTLDSRLRFTRAINVYARVQGDPRAVMPRLRDAVRHTDSNLVVFDMRTMDEQLNMRLANERLLSFLSAGFALLASLLAVVGLHGVLAFVVARRTREIGIRIALGADAANVIRLVMKEMLAVIVLGIAAGVGAGILCSRYVESQLFGVKAADLSVYGLSVALLLGAALSAAYIPAWRASRINPMRALRYE